MNSVPRIVSLEEVPLKVRKPPARIAPAGRNPERAAIARDVMKSLAPGEAALVEFQSLEEMQSFRCHCHVIGQLNAKRVKTRSHNLRLYVWLDQAQQMELAL